MKPRDKLKVLGVSSLTDTDLLAIILGSGTKQSSVYTLSNRIAKIIGVGEANPERLYKKITNVKGVGDAKALCVVASVELGKRLFQNPKVKVLCTKDVWFLAKELNNRRQESVFVIYLNGRRQFVAKREIAVGSGNCATIDVKTIFYWAFRLSAPAFILVHNHPSGDCKPSQADFMTTDKLKKAAFFLDLDFCDHVIVSREGYRSII